MTSQIWGALAVCLGLSSSLAFIKTKMVTNYELKQQQQQNKFKPLIFIHQKVLTIREVL